MGVDIGRLEGAGVDIGRLEGAGVDIGRLEGAGVDIGRLGVETGRLEGFKPNFIDNYQHY